MKKAMLLLWCAFFVPAVMGEGGPCSNYAPSDCEPHCGDSCKYYTFSSASITKTINEIPFNLLSFFPDGEYCGLQGEDGIFAMPIMRKIPFKVGPYEIKKLPRTITLTYKVPKKQEKTGGACSSSGSMNNGPTGDCCDRAGDPGCPR